MSSVTVKAAAASAFLITGVGAAAAVGASFTIADRVAALPGAIWITIVLGAAGLSTSILSWRLTSEHLTEELDRAASDGAWVRRGGILPGASLALLSLLITMSGDWAISTMALLFMPPLTGWMVARAALLASESVTASVRSAATGIVTVSASGGLLLAVQIVSQGLDAGIRSAGKWAFGYSMLAISILAVAQRVKGRSEEPQLAVRSSDTNSSSLLSIRNLTVSFGQRVVLREVSFTADAGELLAVIGSNGAGKSTLLRAAAGGLSPMGGSVLLGGADVTALLMEERLRMGLAFVSGAHPVFPDLTVLENLRVAAHHMHARRRSFAAATEPILDLVPRLRGRLGSRAGVLSGGEQRLLALAQTMYQRPSVLLVDELTMGLDQDARVLVLDLLRHLADQGVAVVVVDHDLDALLSRADAAVAVLSGSLEIHRPPARALELHRELIPAEFLAGANA